MPPAAETNPIDPDMTQLLLDQLARTADAHGVYEAEELAGVYDTDWPQWYAQHMARALTDAGYRLTRTQD